MKLNELAANPKIADGVGIDQNSEVSINQETKVWIFLDVELGFFLRVDDASMKFSLLVGGSKRL